MGSENPNRTNRLESQTDTDKQPRLTGIERETIPPSEIVAVISPDFPAGEDFTQIMRENDTLTENRKIDMPARVVTVEGAPNILNPDNQPIANALATAIEQSCHDGHFIITQSCCTASHEDRFVVPALAKLESKGLKYGEDYIFLSPLAVLKDKYEEMGNQPPVVLSTTALGREIPIHQFETLSNTGRLQLADLTQEIIWREKGAVGSDVRTAPKYPSGDLKDERVYNARLLEWERLLHRAGIAEAILGCTDLPGVVERLNKLNPNHGIRFENPAVVVAERARIELAKHRERVMNKLRAQDTQVTDEKLSDLRRALTIF